jgi:hypothetical protein
MERRFHRNEDLCPVCGHLMSKNMWNCSFCDWSLKDLQLHYSGIESWGYYSDIDAIPSVNRDIDRLLDYC